MKSPKPTDLRSPAEREMAERRAGYFARYMGMPDLGWAEERERFLPELKEDIAGAYADLGWGPQHVGPQGAATAKALEQRRRQWDEYVLSGGGNIPEARYAPREPSPFASLLGPVAAGVGYGIGGPIGGAVGGSVGGYFGMEQNPYTGVWQKKQ